MSRGRKKEPTELNKNDRKTLEKYTGFYTNMIESNTASVDIHEDQAYKPKE